jgi:hypothetical protein
MLMHRYGVWHRKVHACPFVGGVPHVVPLHSRPGAHVPTLPLHVPPNAMYGAHLPLVQLLVDESHDNVVQSPPIGT